MVAKSLPTALPEALKEPITPALVAAAAIHALLLLAVGFGFEWPEIRHNTIAVTFTMTPSSVVPERARHVAGDDQLGALEPAGEAPQLALQTSLTLSRELDVGSGDLPSDALSTDSIERQIEALEQALSSLSDSNAPPNPRLGAVAARRALDAQYLARWRARVEQVGNTLYRGEPPAGNGDVRLLVTVLSDGSLESIRIIKSSGIPALDQAAQDTVVLAAPFPPFSAELARSTSRLEIVRTWQFRSTAVTGS